MMLLPWRFYYYRWRWMLFWDILHTLNRCEELRRLIEWAEGKKLSGPARAYRARLQQDEFRVGEYRLRHTKLARWARILFWVGCVITPTPRHFARGAAAHYRSRPGREVEQNNRRIHQLASNRRSVELKERYAS